MPQLTPTTVAVIGCGHWGGNYVRLLHSLGRTGTIACDLDQGRLAALLRQHAGLRVEKDYQQVLRDDEVTAVVVATTAGSHYDIAMAAIDAGKGVLIEKPMTLSAEQGRELVRRADAAERTLMVGHTFLFNPAVRHMRELLKRGEAGSVYYLNARRTHLGLVRPDVNAVWDLATHDISIFGYLLGTRPESVSAVGGRYLSTSREDVAFITLSYPRGIVGNIFVSWVDSNKMREVALIGSRARIVFDDLNHMEKLKIYHKGVSIDRPYNDFGEFQLLVRDGDIISPCIETTEPLRAMTEHFLECVTTGKQPETSGRDGVDVITILEAIDQSLARGGAPVKPEWLDGNDGSPA